MIKIKAKGMCKTNLIIMIIIVSSFAYIGLLNNNYVKAHNQQSLPIEMYSLWNNTNPILDGLVNFNSSNLATEWSGAAVYNLFDKNNLINSKILIKNDNTNLFIGLDVTSYQTETPESDWGASVYFDVNHNGILDNSDVGIRYFDDGIEVDIYYYIFNEISNQWDIEETGSPGIALSNNILVNSDFSQSFFELSNHRQYEMRIPLTIINKSPGQMVGIGFEVFENYDDFNEELTWPYVSEIPEEIREDARFWGDLFLCEQLEYTKFSIEENFNIKRTAIGPNNGLYITSGDIDGNADLELIVASNRSVSGDENLIAIFNFVDNELTRIWSSWTSVHYTKLFPIKGLVAYDFDGDGKDEIYGVGEDSRISRISEWNPSTNDFDSVETVFTHSRGLMGYVAIGDADNEGGMNLVVGDQSGYILILDYDSGTDKFVQDKRSPYLPKISLLNPANRIHAVEVADMDSDGKQEILAFLQTSSNGDLSPTILNVFERQIAKVSINDEDDIPDYGSELTEDFFGHTIIVEDVDNDGTVETILASKNYLRIFGANTFDGGSPPLEFLINDGTNPSMGGGAFVDDFDDDGFNELVFGFNNGTITVMNITDSGGDVLTYSIEWTNDLGSSPGKRKGFSSYDIDDDSETEIIFSDNFGQIFIIGKSDAPTIEISSPSDGYTTNQPTILVTWVAEDDHVIHHFDVNIEGIFINRLPGSQTSIRVPITNPTNLIEITAYDVNGKNISTSIEVIYDAFAPEIFITFPSNNYFTKNDYVLLEYYNFDPNDNFIYYEIYRNDQLIITSYTLDYYNINLPTQGLYNITIKGIDDLGFEGKSSIFITRDYTPPYIDITNPIFGSYVSSSEIDLRWTTSDLYSELSHFDIYMNGDFVTTTTYYHQIISLNVDRYYLFEVFAFDILGNNKSDTVSITKDSISPYVNILSHTSGSIIQSSTINLVWSVSDNYQGSGIQYSEVFVNQESKYSGTLTSSIIDLGNDGLKDIQVVTYDRAGNSKFDVIFLTLDQSGPFVEILTPFDNYNTSLSFIPLSWYAQDNGTGIKEYKILIDGIIEHTITTTTFLLTIPLDKSSIITVRAIDLLNQTTEDSIVVNQNSIYTILEMTNPIGNLTYISENEIEITWAYQNIENIISIDLFVNGTNVLSTTDTGVSSFLVDLSFIPSSIYPEINITIAYFTNSINYSVTKWIIVDQESPIISIITPSNNSIIYYKNQYIQWTGYDQGVGLEYFELKLDEQSLIICTYLRNYYYLIFNLGDANYSVSLYAMDKAGNIASLTITLIVKIQLPIIGTNLSSIYYTSTGEFQFNLNIIDPKEGIQKFQILLDSSNIHTVISYPEFIIEAVSYLFNITTDDYTDTDLEGQHTLEIIIIDALNRESHTVFSIIVDSLAPIIQPTMYFDDRIISNNSVDVEIKVDNSQNNHSISITVSDNQLIESVIVIITGNGYYQTYFMIRTHTSRSEIVTYEITFNLTGLEKGTYQITIQAFDYAGNSQEVSINLDVSYERTIPWFLQGVYAIYFALIILAFILIVSFIAVVVRKSMQNRNWIDDVISVLYIKETGLTCVSANYIPQLIQEEQLIGGAMIVIQGIIEEINKERKSKVEIMNLGAQSLLISKGEFGLGALIVKSIKPVHKSKILQFTNEFEKKYKDALKLLYFVDSTTFDKSIQLVEKYFGTLHIGISGVIQNGITQQLQEYKNARKDTLEYQIDIEDDKKTLLIEKTPIDELLEQISREGRNQLVKIIEKAPKIILLIVELKFDEAEKMSQEILTGLEFLLRIERTNVELQLFIQNMMTFSRETNNAIMSGRENNQVQLHKAIENASQIWFQEIAEKWSNIE